MKLYDESFEEYFEPMEIPQEDKDKRVELAKKLQEDFDFILWVIAHLKVQGEILEMYTVELSQRLQDRYKQSVKEVYPQLDNINNYNNYVSVITQNIIVSTINQLAKDRPEQETVTELMEEEYAVSSSRARVLAVNEANTVGNIDSDVTATKEGKKHKTWCVTRDGKERASHSNANGQTVNIDDYFHVGSCYLAFPKDTSLGATPEEIVNCRCWLEYS